MNKQRRIAVLTGTRAEYGLLYWTIRRIQEDPELDLTLLVTGMHLSPEFGLTVGDIEQDGFPIAARVESLASSDTGEGVATSMGIGTIKMAQVLAQLAPDILLVLGDRTEVLATVTAALPLLIPVAHLHGGESSEGAIDESIRHAVTKLSHLHFASTDLYAKRLIQMGEEDWRVHVSGAPALEHMKRCRLADRGELERELGLDLSQPTLLVTHHPETLFPEKTIHDVRELMAALETSGMAAVITYPNADSGGRAVIEEIQSFASRYPKVKARVNLGMRLYLGLMGHVAALVGNSSSGIIEAASLGTPVVNVGERQRGRIRGVNVVDVPAERDAILSAIEQVSDPSFRQAISKIRNPYDRGCATDVILPVLKQVPLGKGLLQKRLVDLPLTLETLLEGERIQV